MTKLVTDLLMRGPIAVNIGVGDFADSLRAQGAPVIEVRWSPPTETDEDLRRILDTVL